KSPLFATDLLPYTTLMYGNGPGHKLTNNKRPDIRDVDTTADDYVQQSAVPLDSETHGGEDVALFARGPMAHLFQGVYEQNYIAHAMAYANTALSLLHLKRFLLHPLMWEAPPPTHPSAL
ncbi:hypothetical protein M9458_031205, partial [Cirrhinus mrigala]